MTLRRAKDHFHRMDKTDNKNRPKDVHQIVAKMDASTCAKFLI